jgi:hypothetical protein
MLEEHQVYTCPSIKRHVEGDNVMYIKIMTINQKIIELGGNIRQSGSFPTQGFFGVRQLRFLLPPASVM